MGVMRSILGDRFRFSLKEPTVLLEYPFVATAHKSSPILFRSVTIELVAHLPDRTARLHVKIFIFTQQRYFRVLLTLQWRFQNHDTHGG